MGLACVSLYRKNLNGVFCRDDLRSAAKDVGRSTMDGAVGPTCVVRL